MTCPSSLFRPAVIYHCDLTKEPLHPHVFREVTVKGFDPSDYQTTQVRYLPYYMYMMTLQRMVSFHILCQ